MSYAGPIILSQSAVGPVYEAMLDASEPLHGAFCRHNDVEFRTCRTVMRGFYPWQACYNRILILKTLLDEGFAGWFIHLDADAVVRHLDFDIRRYFGKRPEWAMIAAASAPDVETWNINDGVFFLNLGHPSGAEIVRRWHHAFVHNLTDDMLRSASTPWRYPDGTPFPGDQHLIQMELKGDPALLDTVLVEDAMLINHRGARFIRQYLRAHGSAEERLDWIRQIAAELA